MTNGKFITVEGGDGVGKSTQISLIYEFLRGKGLQVKLTREPGGTEIGEMIRNWILYGEHDQLDLTTEASLMFAARAYHVDHIIRPSIENGIWVVSDRFTDATYAYQGYAKGLNIEVIETLEKTIINDFKPHMTFLLDSEIDLSRERMKDRTLDYFEREDDSFYHKIRKGYLKLANANKERIKIINASQSIENVNAEINSYLEALI
ncbi:MAG: dTMP kinase [Gammaproteobacteria bacterium]